MKSLKTILFSTIILLFIKGSSFGQVSEKLGARKYINSGDNFVLQSDYILAIDSYKKAIQNAPKDYKTIQKLAKCYIENKEFTKAVKQFNVLINNNYSKNENSYLKAHCHKNSAKYEFALEILEPLLKEKLDRTLRKLITLEIENCQFAINTINDPKGITIFHLKKPVNDIRSEYSPYFINDSIIIYAQVEPTDEITYSIYDSTPIPNAKLFYASYNNNKWEKGNKLNEIINTTNTNILNGSFSLDKKRFYYNTCYKNWQYKNVCNIYASNYKDNIFETPYKLGNSINNNNFTSSHPTSGSTYNKDLEIIYFASDRPGGRGGMDIWFTVYNMKYKTYTEPKNAGSKINTEKDEITPFYNNITKTLYYSSNGKVGLGCFDIYKATGEMRRWLPAKNLGSPFNTNADDVYYVNNEKQNRGFIVSNRQGSYLLGNEYCCYDMFFFKYNDIEQITLKGKLEATIDSTIQKYFKKGIVFRNQDSILDEMNKYYENTIVSLYIQNELENDSIYITSDTANKIGEYLFNVEKDQEYNIIFHDEKEFKGQLKVLTDENDVINNQITVNPLKISIIPEEALIITNIYYDFNESFLNEASKAVLDSTLISLLIEKPDFSIEVSSHTDSIGDDNYNIQLSEKRAENVAKYLNSRGIEKERMQTIGYGESIPIAPNSFPDGNDNPSGRELNRRTEFKIISTELLPSVQFK